MKRRDFFKNSLLVSAGLSFGVNSFSANVANKEKQPNIVFFFCDDLGMYDLGCYGSTGYETPNIDKFAKESMKFINAYAAAPICSPTRASIMTGRHPARLYKTTVMRYHEKSDYVKLKGEKHPKANTDEGEILPNVLHRNGYQTGFVGKLHTYGLTKDKNSKTGVNTDVAHWDYAYRTGGHVRSYFYPFVKNCSWHDAKPGEYLTDHLTDKAINFLDSTKRDKPFFLYLGHNAPHTPTQAKEEDVKYFEKKWGLTGRGSQKIDSYYKLNVTKSVYYKDHIITKFGKVTTRTKQDNPVYAGMLKSLDESFGRLYNKLDEMGISDNTIIIIYSDNGGMTNGGGNGIPRKDKRTGVLILPKPGATSNLPFNGGKCNIYEGGIREPLLIKYPGFTKVNTTCDALINTPDFYPTFLEMAGIPLMPEQHKDGNSFVHLLKGKDGVVNYERPVFWHHPHYWHFPPMSAVRKGDWKLMKQWYIDKLELYNLKEDIGELKNVSEQYPEKTKELEKLLMHWLEEDVYAERLMPNPKYKE